MPSLREMREDIPLIANAILARLSRGAPTRARARRPCRRSSAIRSPATCASSRTSSSAACRSRPTRSRSPPRTCTSRRVVDESRCRAAHRRQVAAAGLPRPRRALGDQRGAREDALQPHGRGEAPRHHLPRDALPDGAAGHQVSTWRPASRCRPAAPAAMVLDAAGFVAAARQLPSPNQRRAPGRRADPLVVDPRHLAAAGLSIGGDGIVELFTNRLDPAAHPYFAAIAQPARLRALPRPTRRRADPVRAAAPRARGTPAPRLERLRALQRLLDRHRARGHRRRCPTTDAQYATLVALVAALRTRYPIEDVVGHSDIAPGRKTDPGPGFDWTRLPRRAPTLFRTVSRPPSHT